MKTVVTMDELENALRWAEENLKAEYVELRYEDLRKTTLGLKDGVFTSFTGKLHRASPYAFWRTAPGGSRRPPNSRTSRRRSRRPTSWRGRPRRRRRRR